MPAAPMPARTTVRGFQTPITSGDEDSDYGARTQSLKARRGKKGGAMASAAVQPTIDDVVSANCSPATRAAPSPALSGIAKLRAMEPLSLDTGSRTSTMTTSMTRTSTMTTSMTRTGSQLGFGLGLGFGHHQLGSSMLGVQSVAMSRTGSRDTTRSDASSDGATRSSEGGDSTSYEVDLETDFVSESVKSPMGIIEGGLAPHRKMTATDFEPLRCLGKGAYGTVILVKQRSTGRLYAQKQFKKASLVVHKKLVEQTKTERQILESVNRHPFIVNLYYAFQDQEKLYLILEYGQGGELFTHLNTEKIFAEPTAAFYMAEMFLAITHLHNDLGVVYRDLKPENCLLDAEGHLLLTDFGLSKVAADDADVCNSMLGTVEYMAPEVIKGEKYGRAVDWWSFGALGFDLLTGHPPFRGGNNAKIQDNIVRQKLTMPYFLGPDAKDLLVRLLKKDPAKRLGGNMPRDMHNIRSHRFFRKIDWKRLKARELMPPIQPLITDPELAENFSADFTELSLSPVVSARDGPWSPYSTAGAGNDGAKDDPFGGFSFVASSSLLENEGFQYPLAGPV